jgi:dsDNA-specific endonuclease/ATPase MutS2
MSSIFTSPKLQALTGMHSCLYIHFNGEITPYCQRRSTLPRISRFQKVPPSTTTAARTASIAAAAQGSSPILTVLGTEKASSTSNQAQATDEKNERKSKHGSRSNNSNNKNKAPHHRRGPAEQESLELLGWLDVCNQVASFCKTAMGAQQSVRGKLPLGTTIEESKVLLQQTKEAAELNLNFKKIYFLRRALDAATAQHALHPLVLGAIATTLNAAKEIGEKVDAGGESTVALHHLARGIRDFLPEVASLLENIHNCIQISEGRVLDSASELLESTRRTRQENITALRRTADDWARTLHESGAAERPQVVVRRDRLCIPVRAGRQSDLPRGSVALATSASGSTVYMEPAPMVPLNNAEAQLGAVEKEEEDRILGELTAMVAKKEKKIKCILASVTALDIASARAKHAAWLGAVEPVLKTAVQGEEDIINSTNDDSTMYAKETTTDPLKTGLVHIAGVVHPLLMQPFLPPLAKPPLPEITLSIGPSDPSGSGSLAGVNLVPELWNEIEAEAGGKPPAVAAAVPHRKRRGSSNNTSTGNSKSDSGSDSLQNITENNDSSSASASASGSSSLATAAGNVLVPIDLIVPVGKKVVAVTGPNTGGKTASLKALGLVSLMAKAGMFIPISSEARKQLDQEEDGEAAEEKNQHPLSSGQKMSGKKFVSIAWFDKILADLGDGQSLQQSLSTFSGHVRRLRGILHETTPSSLVLLDEVGSGTDPGEGAALAAALLLHLSKGRAALTYATTHHAELKEVATTNPLFVNASVEFNIELLRPTYKLLWGKSGDSNALAVASGLGFDPKVVQDAREVAMQLSSGTTSAAARAVALRESLEVQAVSAKSAAAEATRRRKAAEKELKEAEEVLKLQQEEHTATFSSGKKSKGTSSSGNAGDGDDKDVYFKIKKVISDARGGKITPEAAEKELKRIEKSLASSNEAAMTLAGLKWGSGDGDGDGSSSGSGSDDDSTTDQFLLENGARSKSNTVSMVNWDPKAGDYVKVLKMGGAIGQILNISGSSGSGAKFSVSIGQLTIQLRRSDVAPSSTPPPPMKSSPGGRFPTANKLKANGAFKPDNLLSAASSSNNNRNSLGVAIQTSRNTVDCRGMNTDEAVAAVEVAVNDARPGSVVFAVHGVGTGRVRTAVLEALRKHPSVVKLEEAEASNGGCTVAYMR